jgi:CBS domain containing-hemolysin-like protein
MIDMGVDEKAIEAAESQMLNKMLDFSDTPVSRAMIPMRNVIVFDSGTTVKAAKEIAVGHGFSRYPVRNAATGEVIGVVHIKYLDRLIQEGKGEALLGDILLKEASLLITANEKLDVLFRKMQREHIHMAVVVDEANKQVGVVTFEDLVEAIFGPIADEEEARRGKALK